MFYIFRSCFPFSCFTVFFISRLWINLSWKLIHVIEARNLWNILCINLSSKKLLIILMLYDITMKNKYTLYTAFLPPDCPKGWTYMAEFLLCFKYVDTSDDYRNTHILTYTEAQSRCGSDGGELAQPSSSQLNQCIYKFARLVLSSSSSCFTHYVPPPSPIPSIFLFIIRCINFNLFNLRKGAQF